MLGDLLLGTIKAQVNHPVQLGNSGKVCWRRLGPKGLRRLGKKPPSRLHGRILLAKKPGEEACSQRDTKKAIPPQRQEGVKPSPDIPITAQTGLEGILHDLVVATDIPLLSRHKAPPERIH